MFSKELMTEIADAHYEDFKEEIMDLTCLPSTQIAERIFEVTNGMVNGTHRDDAFDAGREILEIMECKWVHEQFNNISGFNTPEFLSKYETKIQTDLRVKLHGDNEYCRGYEDAVQTWEGNFANMSAYEFSEWKLKHKDLIKTPASDMQPELDHWIDNPTPEEEQAWKEFANRIKRGDK